MLEMQEPLRLIEFADNGSGNDLTQACNPVACCRWSCLVWTLGVLESRKAKSFSLQYLVTALK